MSRLTSPCSRRAAARRRPHRELPGPRPAAEGQLVRQWRDIIRSVVVSAMAVSLAIAAVPTPASEEPTPSELLASTSAAYRDLNAFDVTGVVDSALIDDHGQVGPLLFGHRDFTCFYSAPEAFVFSMVHRGSADYKPWSLVLAINGANATLAAPPALETETSDVPKALSGASSITSQASSLLVGLLLPNAESGFQLSELSEAHIDGTEVIRDVPCWRVS